LWVNLYISSSTEVSLGEQKVAVAMEGRYPWSGQIKIRVDPAASAGFPLRLRIPQWCNTPVVRINGKDAIDSKTEKGYLCIRRTWQKGDVVELNLPMEVRRTEANPRVAADVGRVAVERGPLVYCLEGVDNAGGVRNLSLPRGAELKSQDEQGLLGGVTVIRGQALAAEPMDWSNRLYQPAGATRRVDFTAIPYYSWDHRAPGPMVVWLPEAVGMAERPPLPTKATTAKLTVSHCFAQDSAAAVNDGLEPSGSSDQGIPRMTFWDHKGTLEWLQYAFAASTAVSGCSVYWFDDSKTGGGCSVPKSWRILYKKGDAWEPVKVTSRYPTEVNAWNRAEFDAVQTAALRMEVQLQPDRSGGILEWKLD